MTELDETVPPRASPARAASARAASLEAGYRDDVARRPHRAGAGPVRGRPANRLEAAPGEPSEGSRWRPPVSLKLVFGVLLLLALVSMAQEYVNWLNRRSEGPVSRRRRLP